MRQNRRLDGIKLWAGIAASALLLPLLGSSVANAQRPIAADDSDVFQAQKQAQDPSAKSAAKKGIGTALRMPGAGVPGSATTDASTTVVAAPAVGPGGPPPTSSCTSNVAPPMSHTCNVFETDGSGNPSEISNVIALPNPVQGGYLVMKHNGSIADSDVSNWSDVLKFGDGTSAATSSMQLFSRGCNTSNPNDTSCFPPYTPGDSAFVVESNPGPTIFVASPNTYNIYSIDDDAPVRPWTSAASTGALDEDSVAIARFNSFAANLKDGTTGSVHIRYPITPVEGISRLCPAEFSTIRTRFRNSDTNGNVAKVSYEIHSSSISSGGNIVLHSFSSNGRGGGNIFKSATQTVAIDFDFANNMYWIEATIFRSSTQEYADLGTIQIWESAGRFACTP